MSVHYTSMVWKMEDIRGNAKLLLLSLADQANDDGVCWPSVKTLMGRIGVTTQRAVQQLLADLEDAGHIRREYTAGKSTTYRLVIGEITQGVNAHSSRTTIHPERGFRGGVNAHSSPPLNAHSSPVSPPIGGDTEPSFRTVREPLGGKGARESANPSTAPKASRPNAAASRGSRLPAGFAPSDENWEWAKSEYPDIDPQSETVAFIDYWCAKAGKDGVKLDWQATWRNWIRRAAEYSARRQSPTPSRASPLAPFPPRETAFQAARRRNLEIIAEWGAEMDAAIDEQEQRLQEQSHGHDEPTNTASDPVAGRDGVSIIIPTPTPARAGRAGATLERLGYAGARGFDA